uniref:Uncharacterized protein n=1 Tax=Anguilla anguilla TaxID=7936 RepID=A0A0E9XIQ9_ANGAN
MPKTLHAFITGLPSITWKIHHSTTIPSAQIMGKRKNRFIKL